MPLYEITYIQEKSGKATKGRIKQHVYFQKDISTLQVAFNASKYIAEWISFPSEPGYKSVYDWEFLISYSIQISIFNTSTGTKRNFVLQETKNEAIAFVKTFDKKYTIIDGDNGKPIGLPRDMFYQFQKEFSFEIKVPLNEKKKTPEILTPMGGAVKKK